MTDRRPEFASVRLLIGDGNTQMRQGLRSALAAVGFKSGADTSDLMEIEASLSSGGVDLLICDTGLEDSRINEMTRRVRHQELGYNPFPVVITITDDPTPEAIREIIDSGADGLLAKPVSTGVLVERVLLLAKDRKRFVVTSDYIGPTRRKETRPGTENIPEIEVPNPVKIRAAGQADSDALRNDIEWNARILDELRLERCVVQFEYLSDHIRSSFMAVTADEPIPPMANRLWSVAKDMGRRLARSEHADVVPLCRPFQDLAGRLGDASVEPTRQDIDRLPEMVAEIKDALHASQAAAEESMSRPRQNRHLRDPTPPPDGLRQVAPVTGSTPQSVGVPSQSVGAPSQSVGAPSQSVGAPSIVSAGRDRGGGGQLTSYRPAHR